MDMTQTKPNIGSVVKVTTRRPNEWILSTDKWRYNVHEGVVVRSNAWDQPDTFKLQVDNPMHPNPIIALHNVHEIVYVSGEGSAVSDSIKSITVKGSKGNVYTVTKVGGQWQCTCPGYQFRKACKHLDEARKQ